MQKLIFLTLLLATAPLSAGMYKWVDENGVTHYSQRPPTGQQAERMRPPPPPPVDPDAARKELQDKVQAVEDRKDVEALKREEQTEQTVAAENRRERCKAAKRNLETLEISGNRRIVMPNGDIVRPTEAQREAEMEKARKEIEQSCD